MKHIRFFLIKLIILHIVNLIGFAVAALTDMLTGFFFTKEQAFLQTALVCFVGFAVFAWYLFTSTKNMKESELPPAFFVIREALSYMIFASIPTVAALINGITNLSDNLLLRFYLPNLAGAHLTGSPVLGFILQTLVFTLILIPAHNMNCKKWAAHRADEERKRAEDDSYAEQLLAEQEKTEEKDLD